VLQAVTYVIFSEPQSQGQKDGGPLLPLLPRKKVKTHVSSALVGIGTVYGGAPGLPLLTQIIGDTAVEQGRYVDPKATHKGPVVSEDSFASPPLAEKEVVPRQGDFSEVSEEDDSDIWEIEQDVEAYGRALIEAREASKRSGLTEMIVPPSPTLARRKTTSSLRGNDEKHKARHRRAESSRPNASTPVLLDTSSPTTLQSSVYQSRLLRSHYLHSEVQFLQTLSSIS
jgi:hypothetical protein